MTRLPNIAVGEHILFTQIISDCLEITTLQSSEATWIIFKIDWDEGISFRLWWLSNLNLDNLFWIEWSWWYFLFLFDMRIHLEPIRTLGRELILQKSDTKVWYDMNLSKIPALD